MLAPDKGLKRRPTGRPAYTVPRSSPRRDLNIRTVCSAISSYSTSLPTIMSRVVSSRLVSSCRFGEIATSYITVGPYIS